MFKNLDFGMENNPKPGSHIGMYCLNMPPKANSRLRKYSCNVLGDSGPGRVHQI